ncbi:MAG: hypothetical protein ABI418_16235 [Jatrophihabitantaceae bacterium]
MKSSDLARFVKRVHVVGGNTEQWKLLWRRAIVRSAASHLSRDRALRAQLTSEQLDDLKEYSSLLGDGRFKRNAVDSAKEIIDVGGRLNDYLDNPEWADAEALLAEIIGETRPIFLYIDSLDDTYRWAPTLWTQCQRGLFYTVMDLLRDNVLNQRLHVVVAIRDVTYASIWASENALRYIDSTHISVLDWNRDSIRELLRQKLKNISSQYFTDPKLRTVESWLGFASIVNSRPEPSEERLEDYILRHTRLVPRDIVALGNDLCQLIATRPRSEITAEMIRATVAGKSKEFASAQIATCANQAISDLLPAEAVDDNHEDSFLQPNEYMLAQFQGHVLDCIETTGREIFDTSGLESLMKCASKLFGGPVHLADILWQQGLLGIVEDDRVEFFSLSGSKNHVLPRLGADASYCWNPILFDLTKRLEHARSAPF